MAQAKTAAKQKAPAKAAKKAAPAKELPPRVKRVAPPAEESIPKLHRLFLNNISSSTINWSVRCGRETHRGVLGASSAGTVRVSFAKTCKVSFWKDPKAKQEEKMPLSAIATYTGRGISISPLH